MSDGLCEKCGHCMSQCQCGTLAASGIKFQINFTKLFLDWWSKAKSDNDARYEQRMASEKGT